ncbi:MAG: hypothetical protein PWR10_2198 [Halanaerobiales bacterium]|nr:hypothetical protein [Halanaerobiales bacterium]
MKEKQYLEKLTGELAEKYQEGVKQLELGNFAQAEKLLIEVKEERPDFVPVYNKLGIIAIYRKNLDRAKNWLTQALELDKEFVPAITNLGSIKREEGDRDLAREYYLKAIQLDPDYGPAYNNLGVIYREEGNYRESVKYLKKANKLKSYTIDASKDRLFYKEPGCIVPLIIMVGLVILYLIFIR